MKGKAKGKPILTCQYLHWSQNSYISSESKRLWNYGDTRHQRTVYHWAEFTEAQSDQVPLFAPLFCQILAIPSMGNKDINFAEMHGYWT